MRLYAHSQSEVPEAQWQTLEEHLNSVAEKAGTFASVFGGGEWARLVALTHDAGKASSAFQRRLRGSSEHVDHSSAGAKILCEQYGFVGQLLAFVVSGHHGGLPNRTLPGQRSSLDQRLSKDVEPFDAFFQLVHLPSIEIVNDAKPGFLRPGLTPERLTYSFTFLLKMLFSCLVDSDYLDTEKELDENRSITRRYTGASLEAMRETLACYMDALESDAVAGAPSRVNRARHDILDACRDAARYPHGLFTLTVPTGGGKTLSALSFSLDHALRNGQERIIYVAPYTTIIDQTARVFKGIFGEESVLEHHSNYEFSDSENGDDEQAMRERLAMENWDVPLVVTTNVQFFESLYSAKTSRSRKVHNIANSVVILDEAQTLPDHLLQPSLAAIEELCDNYSTTVVLCTATQPALEAHWPFGSTATEIVPTERRHSEVFDERVDVVYDGEVSVDELVNQLANLDQGLCVVSSRKAAASLYDRLFERLGYDGLFHLSALMVPAHRNAVLKKIRNSLQQGNRCVVVSTQLVEAGVDIDFPVVFREVAGIDSIMQAAGRCNREGRRQKGQVHVFSCQDFAITRGGWLSAMRALGKETISLSTDPFGDVGIREFFTKRYQFAETDQKSIFAELSDVSRLRDKNFSFERYGEEFKFIEDDAISIFVPWDDEGRCLYEVLSSGFYDIRHVRKAQKYTVAVSRYAFDRMVYAGRVTTRYSFRILEPMAGKLVGYSEAKGLIVEEEDATLTI